MTYLWISRAARGLGYEIARAIVECGTEGVVLLDRKAELVDKAAEEIRQTTGVPVRSYHIDTTEGTSIDCRSASVRRFWLY